VGEIVNLNRAKKQREREEAARLARENRVRHGRTGAQKENDRREERRRRDALDGKLPAKE
jgi:hypothetical protein